MRNRVYVAIRRLSVCLSHRSTATAMAGGFAAERPVGRRYRQTAGGAGAAYQLQARSAAMAPQLGAQQQTHVDRASHYSAAQRILS